MFFFFIQKLPLHLNLTLNNDEVATIIINQIFKYILYCNSTHTQLAASKDLRLLCQQIPNHPSTFLGQQP